MNFEYNYISKFCKIFRIYYKVLVNRLKNRVIMKILLIHSQNVEVVKNKEATSNPQEFPEENIKMDVPNLMNFTTTRSCF